MEKKTIEEAAERYQETTVASFAEESFKAGAKWYAKNQSEQMYSEEEVVRLLEKFKADSKFHPDFNIINWFNLNKKK
jgi:hypothetical protein